MHFKELIDPTPSDPNDGDQAGDGAPPGEVSELLAGIEQQLAQLRNVQRAHSEQAESIADRERRLEALEEALGDRERAIETELARFEEERAERTAEQERLAADVQRDRDAAAGERTSLEGERSHFQQICDEQLNTFSDREQSLAEREQILEQLEAEAREQRDAVERRSSELQQRQGELEAEIAQLREDREAHEQGQASMRDEANALNGRAAELESAVHSMTERAEAAEHDRDEARGRVDAIGHRVSELESLEQRAAAQVEAAEQMKNEAQQQATASAERLAVLESSVLSMTERAETAERDRDEACGRIEALTARVSELEQAERAGGDEASAALQELHALQERLDAAAGESERLREELAAAREQAVDAGELSAKEERISSLTEELEVARRDRNAAQDALADAETRDEARHEELKATVAELEGRLAEADAQLNTDDASLHVRIRELETELASVNRQLVHDGLEMQERIDQLEARVHSGGGAGEDDTAMPVDVSRDGLRTKARQLAEVSAHLQRRRERLQQVRRLGGGRKSPQKGRPTVDMEERAEQIRKLEKTRHEVREAQTSLAERERKMMRQWARPRAIITAGWSLVIAVFAAGLAWLGTSHFFAPTVAASARLKLRSEQRLKLTPEEIASVQDWHVQLLSSDRFQDTLAKRMAERRLDLFSEPESLQTLVIDNITMDTTDPTGVTYTLAGTQPAAMLDALDIVVSTIAVTSRDELESRAVRAWMKTDGERTVDGRARYATLNETAVRDERLQFVGYGFAGIYVVFLVVVGLIYRRLMNTKNEFDGDGLLFTEGPKASNGPAKSYSIAS